MSREKPIFQWVFMLLVLTLAGLVISRFLDEPGSSPEPLSPEVIQRSRTIIETLGQSRPETLDPEERLAVFHAYANLRETRGCSDWINTVRADLKNAEEARKEAFGRLASDCGLKQVAF